MDIKVIHKPNNKHLTEIKRWLVEEEKISNEGFFCNWDIITNSYFKNQLIVITENELTIGFLTFFITDKIATIEIVEIKPDRRRKGVGKRLLYESLARFVDEGALVAELFCSPLKSEKAWKKMGFINFPDGIIKTSKLYLYQILVKNNELHTEETESEMIELWDFEDYRNEFSPKWKWRIQRKENSNELLIPIIHPSSDEWSVSHRIGFNIKEKTIVKNFNMKKHYEGNFLIIDELEE